MRSLLVPLDGTPFGEYALPLAAGIARRAGAELRVVHVHTSPGADAPPVRHYFPDGPYGPSRDSRHAYLDEVVGRLARATAVTATPLLYDEPEVATALRAAASDADLVVMATHGRGPLGRLVYGSVAHDLMRHLRAPVLLVRGQDGPPTLGAEPAVRRVLVPLDGTAGAEHVLGPAVALGTLLGADYTLLRSLPLRYPDGPELSGYYAGGLPRPVDPQQPRVAYDALARCAERLSAQGLEVETRVVFDDQPAASAVLDFARRRPADLIALTSRRRSALRRLLFGSTVDRVIRGAAVPVLVSCLND
jgi:nucleotide-binding universal stress UspA family protein